MAELCRECFIKTWNPSAYDIKHIVMSKDNDFCEGCMDCVPYVDHIDDSDIIRIHSLKEFITAVNSERNLGHTLACVECGVPFDDDDLAFAHETGLCQYCYQPIEALWVMK